MQKNSVLTIYSLTYIQTKTEQKRGIILQVSKPSQYQHFSRKDGKTRHIPCSVTVSKSTLVKGYVT